MKLLFVFALFTLAGYTNAASLRGVSTSSRRQLDNAEQRSLLCRMLLLETMSDDNDSLTTDEIPGCIPIIDDEETADVIPLEALPQIIVDDYHSQLEEGTLFVRITDAALVGDGDDIASTSSSEFLIVDGRRHLEREHQRRLKRAVNGTMTVAIVRISATDSTPTNTTAQLESLFDSNKINFMTQYNKCSNGHMEFVRAPHGVINIQVNQPIAAFGTTGGSKIVTAAQKAIKAQYKVQRVSDLADRVLMCAPPGTGRWVASAGTYHWRAQFNDVWCTSLTATMHELGHTIGLVHSNENYVAYADKTGYMAKGYRSPTSPQRCFNGQNNNHLGWYNDKKVTMTNSTGSRMARKISLAAFVDHSKADADTEPVLVNIANELFVQYNRATKYNVGTGEYKNMVTVTTKPIQGGSQLVAALSPGEKYEVTDFYGSGKNLVIEACSAVQGNWRNPDIMTISVGKNKSVCNEPVQSAEKEEPTKVSLESWILTWINRRRRPTTTTPTPTTSTP